jgi:hypothetical protein
VATVTTEPSAVRTWETLTDAGAAGGPVRVAGALDVRTAVHAAVSNTVAAAAAAQAR